MELSKEKFLFLDCQTTGMRPPVGKLLEVAWGIGSAEDRELALCGSHIIQLPEAHIPSRIQKITGLTDSDLTHAVSDETIFNQLRDYPRAENIRTAIIHYSQFEHAFFSDLFLRYQNDKALPFEVLCSAQITRRLFPTLPSTNIRAVAGYFGASTEELKRSTAHVTATYHIWKALVQELTSRGFQSISDVQTWLAVKKPVVKQKIAYEYRIEKLTRLSFPEKPGIYRMRNKNNEILYVGKAKSLRSRVNSYFRGKKGRDRKKLEMLAQVWNIEYVECATALEAALLESDEIKKLNPPYNVYLKENRQDSIFYDSHFLSETEQQDLVHNLGPFRPRGAIETLRVLCRELLLGKVPNIFFTEIPNELMEPAFIKFCTDLNRQPTSVLWVRDCLAMGLQILHASNQSPKKLDLLQPDNNELKKSDIQVELTVDDVAMKFSRLFLKAAQDYLRARRMTRLLNSKIEWTQDKSTYSLMVTNGKVVPDETSLQTQVPWQGLSLSDYDRMSILLSEIEKLDCKVTFRFSNLNI